jgi:hypothetical protein
MNSIGGIDGLIEGLTEGEPLGETDGLTDALGDNDPEAPTEGDGLIEELGLIE